MNMKLTFKEYVESKQQLKNALKQCSKIKRLYEVKKYCKLPILEADNKKYISLKPKDMLEILWEYENINDPTPLYITAVNETDAETKFEWSPDKIKKWVKNTTIEIK